MNKLNEIVDDLLKLGFTLIEKDSFIDEKNLFREDKYLRTDINIIDNTYGDGYSLSITYNLIISDDDGTIIAERELEIKELDVISEKTNTIIQLETDLNNMVEIITHVETYLSKKYEQTVCFFQPFSFNQI